MTAASINLVELTCIIPKLSFASAVSFKFYLFKSDGTEEMTILFS